MTALLGFPFRLDNNGNAVCHDDGTAECYTEELAAMATTIPGERILVPSFGLDVVFVELETIVLSNQVSIFGPDVTINSVTTTFINESSSDVTIDYSIPTDPDTSAGTLLPDDVSYYSTLGTVSSTDNATQVALNN
jgi:hypothetical protein